MGCIKPLWLHDHKKKVLAPCGQCPSCRATRATSWSTRLAHEMAYWADSCFVTLTINDEHMPANGSLEKKRLQLFFKRLRKSLVDRKIRYYACGEYGEKTYRAHYHAIIFGLGIEDKTLIEAAWREDGVTIGELKIGRCEMRSIHYVTGYVTKKIERAKDYEYTRLGFDPPFSLQSQGLGLLYAQAHSKYIEQNLSFNLNGLKTKVPRYYVDKLGIDTEKLRDETLVRSEETFIELFNRNHHKFTLEEQSILLGYLDEDPRLALQCIKSKLGIYRQNARMLASRKQIKPKNGVF